MPCGGDQPHPHRKCPCGGDQSGRLTCSHKEDAGAEDDVVPAAVEPPGADAEPAQQEQDGAEDGEDAGGAHNAWPGGRQSAGAVRPAASPGAGPRCWPGTPKPKAQHLDFKYPQQALETTARWERGGWGQLDQMEVLVTCRPTSYFGSSWV